MWFYTNNYHILRFTLFLLYTILHLESIKEMESFVVHPGPKVYNVSKYEWFYLFWIIQCTVFRHLVQNKYISFTMVSCNCEYVRTFLNKYVLHVPIGPNIHPFIHIVIILQLFGQFHLSPLFLYINYAHFN